MKTVVFGRRSRSEDKTGRSKQEEITDERVQTSEQPTVVEPATIHRRASATRAVVTNATKHSAGWSVRQGRAGARKVISSTRWFLGFSRHGVVAVARIAREQTQAERTRSMFTRALSLLAASILIGLGVSLFLKAQLGVPPYDVMLTAVRDRTGLSLGQAGWLFTGFLMTIAFALGQKPKFSGLVYVIANGVAVDTFLGVISAPDQVATRIVFVLLGMLALAAAVALVLHSELTGGSLDLLMRAGQERGLDPIRVRTALELGIVSAGVVLGGDFGIATLVFAALFSPLIRTIQLALQDHRRGRATRLERKFN